MQESRRTPFELPASRVSVRATARFRRASKGEAPKLLSPTEVVTRAEAGELPSWWSMRVAPAGLLSLGEELELERADGAPHPERVGDAVCLLSGGRLAFRRLLGVRGAQLRLRCDVAPFEDAWDGGIVGYVKPRPIDRLASVDPVLWTRANWQTAMAVAHATAFPNRFKRRKAPDFTFRTELLSREDWPRIRAFWLAACGTPLPSEPHEHQHVVGMFVGATLAGVNIHLFTGSTSYSAFTLVHPDYRGTGGGRAMIEHSVRIARARGNERIYVHIDARNFASMAAYRNVGFRPTGWWADEADPMAAAERQWRVFELAL